MVDASEDSPTFDRQRRNVMVSCLIVIAVYVLKLQYGSIKILEATAQAPQNFDIGWAVLMWYFMLRLYQCDPPHKILELPAAYCRYYLNSYLPTSPLVGQFKQQAALDHNKLLEDHGAGAINHMGPYGKTGRYTAEQLKIADVNFRGVEDLYIFRHQLIKFKLRYQLRLVEKEVYSDQKYEMTLSKARTSYAWSIGFLAASLQKVFFTEYVLPFLLGFGSIMYCCYHHIVIH